MKIFICHASEDKADFVRPLAEALKQHYVVWYDEYMLKLGDSLLSKIDEGLVSCDFGVVVLSKAFFRKNWPQAELNGLFAREVSSRKIILPVWKGVSRAEVEKFSPILASKLAVPAESGIDTVVREIRLAVEASERKQEVTVVDRAMAAFGAIDERVHEKKESEFSLALRGRVTIS